MPSSVLRVFILKMTQVGRSMLLQQTPKLSCVGRYNLYALIVFILENYMFRHISGHPKFHNRSLKRTEEELYNI